MSRVSRSWTSADAAALRRARAEHYLAELRVYGWRWMREPRPVPGADRRPRLELLILRLEKRRRRHGRLLRRLGLSRFAIARRLAIGPWAV